MKKALVLGAAGQDGSYLCEFLLNHGYDVYAGVRPSSQGYERLHGIVDMLHMLEVDVLDQASIDAALISCRPAEVYNLAAQSRVGTSWRQPAVSADVTAVGALRVCDAIKRLTPDARLLQAGSSEMFGDAPTSPQDESTPFHPNNPYGCAKAFAHNAVVAYRRGGLHACNAIMYNHESPRRPQEFVTRKITLGASKIAKGLQRDLQMGNLDTTRDWGFAGDFVDAMWRILQADAADDYVVGTGTGHTVREFCDAAFSALGLDYREYVTIDPKFYRESEATPLVANATKIATRLHWKPSTSFPDMVSMMVQADSDLLSATRSESIYIDPSVKGKS